MNEATLQTASAAGATVGPAARRLSLHALVRVFLRSLFLQASWNPRGMQSLGFAHAMTPALDELYPQRGARAAAVARHLEFFNCHPYLAAGILGAAARLEENVACGAAPAQSVSALKRALAPPFAALGDGFFWLALRPAAALVAASTAPRLGALSVVLFLVLYNVVHVGARLWLFVEGYERGEGIVDVVARAHVPSATGALKLVSAVLAGAVAGHSVLAALAPAGPGLGTRPWNALLVSATIVAMTAALPRLRFAWALYLCLAFGLGLGLAIGSGLF